MRLGLQVLEGMGGLRGSQRVSRLKPLHPWPSPIRATKPKPKTMQNLARSCCRTLPSRLPQSNWGVWCRWFGCHNFQSPAQNQSHALLLPRLRLSACAKMPDSAPALLDRVLVAYRGRCECPMCCFATMFSCGAVSLRHVGEVVPTWRSSVAGLHGWRSSPGAIRSAGSSVLHVNSWRSNAFHIHFMRTRGRRVRGHGQLSGNNCCCCYCWKLGRRPCPRPRMTTY